jgi:hypothetical protein
VTNSKKCGFVFFEYDARKDGSSIDITVLLLPLWLFILMKYSWLDLPDTNVFSAAAWRRRFGVQTKVAPSHHATPRSKPRALANTNAIKNKNDSEKKIKDTQIAHASAVSAAALSVSVASVPDSAFVPSDRMP